MSTTEIKTTLQTISLGSAVPEVVVFSPIPVSPSMSGSSEACLTKDILTEDLNGSQKKFKTFTDFQQGTYLKLYLTYQTG